MTLNKEKTKKIILFLLASLSINYLINILFNFNYLFPLLMILTISLVVFYLFYFKVKFKVVTEDKIISFIVFITLLQSLIFNNFSSSIQVIVMSFMPYYCSKFLQIEKKDIKFLTNIYISLGFLIVAYCFQSIRDMELIGRGIFGERNPVGLSEGLGIITMISFYSFCLSRNKMKKIILIGLSIGSSYLNFFILATRGGSFGSFIGCILIYLLLSKRNLKNDFKKIVLSLFFVIVILFITNNQIMLNKFSQLNRFSIHSIVNDPSVKGGKIGKVKYKGRKQNFEESLEKISKQPFIGIGIGKVYAHNIFLDWTAALGLMGLIPLIIFLRKLFNKCLKIKKDKEAVILISLIFYTILIRQFSYSMNAHKSFFIFSGFLISYSYNIRRKFKINRRKKNEKSIYYIN